MRQHYRPLFAGIVLLLLALALDGLGSYLASLPVLVVSFACGVAGAIVAIRGLIDFLSERV